MDNSAEKNPLSRWVDEMQGVMKMITTLIEESDRNRAVVESAQREQAELREEVHRLRAEIETQRMEVDRQRGETERQRALVETTQRERAELAISSTSWLRSTGWKGREGRVRLKS